MPGPAGFVATMGWPVFCWLAGPFFVWYPSKVGLRNNSSTTSKYYNSTTGMYRSMISSNLWLLRRSIEHLLVGAGDVRYRSMIVGWGTIVGDYHTWHYRCTRNVLGAALAEQYFMHLQFVAETQHKNLKE